MSGWINVLTALGISTIIAAIPALIGTLRTLKANKPQVDATSENLRADANATNIAAQQSVITTLQDQLGRRDAAIAELERRVGNLEDKLSSAEREYSMQAANLFAAERQIVDLREQNRMLQVRNDALETHLRNIDPDYQL